MTSAQKDKMKKLNDYVAEVLSEMDGATKSAFMSLSKYERQAMMWIGFHMESKQ